MDRRQSDNNSIALAGAQEIGWTTNVLKASAIKNLNNHLERSAKTADKWLGEASRREASMTFAAAHNGTTISEQCVTVGNVVGSKA